jgi:hypothetical protein
MYCLRPIAYSYKQHLYDNFVIANAKLFQLLFSYYMIT